MESITILQDKHIALAVTGSIACYKAVDLASKLTQAGARVDVIMTQAATHFVAPITFQAVTGRPVYTDMWQAAGGDALPTHIAHVGLAEAADLLAVVPATANSLAKLAQGQADDLLSVTAIATRSPLLIAPAMDAGMYSHSAVQANLKLLKERGAYVVEPEEGRFASGLTGKGRLPETPTLIGHIRQVLGRDGALFGLKVVVSAGGTRESIDPVRYITNRSSGRQGHAVAQAAVDAGAREVILVTASPLPAPVGVERIDVASAAEMRDAILTHTEGADLLVMAAAVADFRPVAVSEQKIKKSRQDGDFNLALTRTDDVLMAVKAAREDSGYPRIVVGFAAESENLLANARQKLEAKGVDLLVANDISAHDAGFAVDTNRVIVLDAEGGQHEVDLASKARIGEALISRVAAIIRS